jgi:hypothetical protein
MAFDTPLPGIDPHIKAGVLLDRIEAQQSGRAMNLLDGLDEAAMFGQHQRIVGRQAEERVPLTVRPVMGCPGDARVARIRQHEWWIEQACGLGSGARSRRVALTGPRTDQRADR